MSALFDFALLLWVLKTGLHGYDKIIDIEKKRFELLSKKADLFDKIEKSSHPDLMMDFIKAKTFIGQNRALRRLAEQKPKELKLIDPKTGKPLLHLDDK